jgi:capsular polysaccharide biosynthesis protein
MSTQHSSSTQEESIDLRRIIETLLRRWPIIVAPLIISVITSVGYILLIQPTVYESSGSAMLPVTLVDSGIGLSPEAYLALANSSPVMELVRDRIDLELSSGQLRSQFEFEIDQGQTISFTASANSAELSFLLADTWLKSYQQELESLIKGQFNQMKVPSAQKADSLLSQITNAEENLAENDLEYELISLTSKLSNLEAILVTTENRLRELNLSSIQVSEASLMHLEETIAVEEVSLMHLEETIAVESMLSQLSDTENRLRELNLFSIQGSKASLVYLEKAIAVEPEYMSQADHLGNFSLNPLYLKLKQDRSDAKMLLNVQQSEAAALSIKVGVMQAQIDEYTSQPNHIDNPPLSLDPLHLKLKQDRFDAKMLLNVQQSEAAALSIKVGVLQAQIDELRPDVSDKQAARQGLEVSLAAYSLAKAELDRLFRIESQLASYTSLSAVREPTQPSGPVSRQSGRNIALAMFLGLVFGVTAALVVDYYQIKPARATPIR